MTLLSNGLNGPPCGIPVSVLSNIPLLITPALRYLCIIDITRPSLIVLDNTSISLLCQVFCNLFDNAAKHGGAGKRIDVSLFQEGEAAVIRIRDYGPGAPEEELPFLKNKFYKGSAKTRGSGIGLAVCEEIVTRHEGRLEVGNAEGGGFQVTLRLPVEI